MTQIPGGLLFPQDVLVSPWFQLLATVVAFNTIVYLGLTISKFVPWPRQFRTSSMRGLFHRLGALPTESGGTPVNVARIEPEQTPFERIRGGIVRRDVPLALTLVGLVMIVVATTNLILIPTHISASHTVQLVCGLLFVVMALVTGRQRLKPMLTIWIWCLLVVVAVAIVAGEAIREDDIVPLGYALILMVAFSPIAMAWVPVVVSLVGQLSLFAYATLVIDDRQDLQFVVVGIAAAATGLLMLRLRMQSIVQIADQWQASRKVAGTDALTGLLTREGLRDLLPPFLATASRQHVPMTLTLVDLLNLSDLNVMYGSAYGDQVLRATARALTAGTNRSFLIARWVGAQFVVLGFGVEPHDQTLAQQLSDAVAADPVTLGKAPAVVGVSSAQGLPEDGQFSELYAQAVAQMESVAPESLVARV